MIIALAAVQVCVYAALSALSFRFGPNSRPTERPIPAMLALLGLAFLCYWSALRVVPKVRPSRHLFAFIVLSSLLFRAVSLVSWPILEIDIYRYIWDGAVTLQGISPYRYSPREVLSQGNLPDASPELDRLRRLQEGNATLHTILSRIHYKELPTIYPPVSQAVFSLAVLITPRKSDVIGYLLIMKTVLVLFDLATLGVVLALLRSAGKHIGWAIAYGWCPLVIKEIANTGHLDSVAVFLTTSALYLAVRPMGERIPTARHGLFVLSSGLMAALAVGAKLYPLVLTPLFVAVWACAAGSRWASVGTVAFVLTTAAVLRPMAPWGDVISLGHDQTDESVTASDHSPPLPTDTAMPAPHRTTGLAAFLRRWEMNDLLFMLVAENLKPAKDVPADRRAWFSVVPERWKERYVAAVAGLLGRPESEIPFLTARLITMTAFLAILTVLTYRVRTSEIPAQWLRAAFLIIAWFWLLSPTQNPWYWLWALPLVMFARSRAWWALAGFVIVYYLRFWFTFHWADQPVLDTPYTGSVFFDFTVTWLEYAPWFLWLAWDALRGNAAEPKIQEELR
ncbi:MAG: hypothetical protein Kow0040_16520 [Thermogutta sp.]